MRNKIFYHGTSSVFSIKKYLLPPLHTSNLREDWRRKNKDVVFFTTSLLSASKFAKKACEKYGGEPVIYEVKPIGQYFNTINGEYISEKALILRKVNIRKDTI